MPMSILSIPIMLINTKNEAPNVIGLFEYRKVKRERSYFALVGGALFLIKSLGSR